MCKTSIENESLWLAVDTYPSPTSTSNIDLLQAQQLNKATVSTGAVTTGTNSGSLGTAPTRDGKESAAMATTDRHPTDAEQEERVRAIREAMRGLLTKHLVQNTRATNHTNKKTLLLHKNEKQLDAQMVKQQEALAKRLDVLLFEKASSLQEYSNTATLEGRVKSLLTHMLGRCLERAANRESSSRERTLCQVLGGKEALRQVLALVQEIKRMQLGAPPPNHKHRRNMSTTSSSSSSMFSVTSMSSCASSRSFSSSSSSFSSVMSNKKMDKPVQDLFLNTPIVQALELTPTDALTKVPWEELMNQAQQVVATYKEWRHVQQPPSKPDLTTTSTTNLLTNSNIRALEQDLQATAADILGTFENDIATAMQ